MGVPSGPDGSLRAAISNAAVRVQRDYLGRGPTKVRASVSDDTVVVVMQDTLTKGERTLVDRGHEDEVLRIRTRLQQTMRDELVSAVEEITGRSVAAFMSGNHIDPDLACEIFILEPR